MQPTECMAWESVHMKYAQAFSVHNNAPACSIGSMCIQSQCMDCTQHIACYGQSIHCTQQIFKHALHTICIAHDMHCRNMHCRNMHCTQHALHTTCNAHGMLSLLKTCKKGGKVYLSACLSIWSLCSSILCIVLSNSRSKSISCVWNVLSKCPLIYY